MISRELKKCNARDNFRVPSRANIFMFLNKGSVCARNSLLVTFRIARFRIRVRGVTVWVGEASFQFELIVPTFPLIVGPSQDC